MKSRLAIALVSIVVGALITLTLVRRDQSKVRLGVAPEKVVPAGTLRFSTARGLDFGELSLLSDGSVSFSLVDRALSPLLSYSAMPDTEGLTLHSHDPKSYLMVVMEPEPVFNLEMPGGKYVSAQAQQGWESRTSVALAKYAYHAIFPEKPQHTLIDTIPTEDVRFVDRNGSLFAVLGSSEAGEPSVVLVRPNGRLLMALTVTRPDFSEEPKQWPTLVLFDRHGAARIQVDLGPGTDPVLTIYEKCDPDSEKPEICRLDPTTGKEIPKVHLFPNDAEGAIPWLRHDILPVSLPMTVRDQRDQILWKSGS